MDQFNELVRSKTAWCLQYEDLEKEDELRVTQSAVGLMDLVESITGTYSHSYLSSRKYLTFAHDVIDMKNF
jgi:hypothetical protein